MSTPTPTREAFCRAFRNGDLATIEAFLAQPHVRADVAATEARGGAPGADGACTWYQEAVTSSPTPTSLLFEAVRGRHIHIIAWFYARRENVGVMGATLARELRDRLTHIPELRRDLRHYEPEILEILLTSDAFCRFLTADEQQRVLDRVARSAHSVALMALAVAHGARVDDPDDPTALAVIAGRVFLPEMMDALVRDGAFVVGATGVMYACAVSGCDRAADSFVGYGADAGNADGRTMRTAAVNYMDRLNMFGARLQRGFADVDACDAADGITALMAVARVPDRYPDQVIMFEHSMCSATARLLEHGADVERVDASGLTALDHAERFGSRLVAQLLRARGGAKHHTGN